MTENKFKIGDLAVRSTRGLLGANMHGALVKVTSEPDLISGTVSYELAAPHKGYSTGRDGFNTNPENLDPWEPEVGKEYTLLPNSKTVQNTPTYWSGVTQVRVLRLNVGTGNVEAMRLGGEGPVHQIFDSKFLLPLTEEPPAPKDPKDVEIERLKALNAMLDGNVIKAKADHQADIKLIGDRLIGEANDRGWCSEYDGIVDELNSDLMVELPLRRQNYQVAVQYTVYIDVEAGDEDDAREEASGIVNDIESRLDNMSGTNSACEVEESYNWVVEATSE